MGPGINSKLHCTSHLQREPFSMQCTTCAQLEHRNQLEQVPAAAGRLDMPMLAKCASETLSGWLSLRKQRKDAVHAHASGWSAPMMMMTMMTMMIMMMMSDSAAICGGSELRLHAAGCHLLRCAAQALHSTAFILQASNQNGACMRIHIN